MANLIQDRRLSAARAGDRHSELGLSDHDVVAMYRTALLARQLDQKIWNLNRMGRAGFVISGQGQEGAQVGTAWAIRRDHDDVFPYYRDFAVVLTLGMTPYEILLSVFARADDPNSGGRQMPNHWGCRRLRMFTGSSPIGTQFPQAAGTAAAARIRGEDRVTVCYFGEGAVSKGDFHEALNFAGIHRLPVVFVCENNGYAISVPASKQSAVRDVAAHAGSYGFPGVVADGNDMLEVYAAAEQAMRRAREGGGPTLLECKTYRYLPHTSDDDDRTYRTGEEVADWRTRDPLAAMRGYLAGLGLLTDERHRELEAEIKAEVNEAARRAEAAAPPTPATVFDHIYARPIRSPRREPGDGRNPRPSGPERNVVDTIRATLRERMASDERVVILGEDVGLLGGVFRTTDGLCREFGEWRVVDTPIAESAIVGIGIGLAMAGMLPVVEIQFADFMHPAFDQLVSEAAKIHYRSNGDFTVPLVVRAPWGGGTRRGLYHSQAVEAFYAHVPGLKVVVPSTPADAAGLLREAIDDPDPVLFLEHKKTYRLVKGPVPEGDWRVPIGVAEVARPGDDLTIVTYGIHRHLSLQAADALAEEDYSVEVVDLRTVSPLDRECLLDSARRTGRMLVVHEDNLSFGVGAEVAALVTEEAFYDLDAPVRRLAMPDVPAMAFAAPLEDSVSIGADQISRAAKALLDQ